MPIPQKVIADLGKKHGPKAIALIVPAIGLVKEAAKLVEDRRRKKVEEGSYHFRKERYIEYNQKIMKNLEQCHRTELLKYKMEVAQFIEQIDTEIKQDVMAKEPIHRKRRKNWESLLVQIDAKLKSKDYQEYLKIYNNGEYTSDYFKGFEGYVKTFKKLIEKDDKDEIILFLEKQTDMNATLINNDFL